MCRKDISGKEKKKPSERRDVEELRQFCCFFRDGSKSIKFKETDAPFLEKITGPNGSIARREYEDEERERWERCGGAAGSPGGGGTGRSWRSHNEDKLLEILGQNRSSGFPNKDFRYVLVCTNLDNPKKNFAWLRNVDWFLILDLGSPCDNDGSSELLNFLRSSTLREVASLSVESLRQVPVNQINDLLHKYGIGQRTLLVRCKPPRGSNSSRYKAIMPGISKMLDVASSGDDGDGRGVLVDEVVVIVLVASNSCLFEICGILKKFSEPFDCTQFVCIFEDINKVQEVNRDMERVFGFHWAKQTVQV